MAIVSTAPTVYPRRDTTPGHVYIRTRSRATTPCGVVMLPSCVLFLFPRESQEIREVASVNHRGENWSREWSSRGRGPPESGFADAWLSTGERWMVLFSGPGSARLCPNTSTPRVAHNTTRSLSPGVVESGSRGGYCGLSLIYHPIISTVYPWNASRWRQSSRWRPSVRPRVRSFSIGSRESGHAKSYGDQWNIENFVAV